MSLTLSVYALFILFMKLVNGAQCLNCANSAPAANVATVRLTSIYVSLKSQKLDLYRSFKFNLTNSVIHSSLSLFVSIRFLLLNLVGGFGVLSIKFIIF